MIVCEPFGNYSAVLYIPDIEKFKKSLEKAPLKERIKFLEKLLRAQPPLIRSRELAQDLINLLKRYKKELEKRKVEKKKKVSIPTVTKKIPTHPIAKKEKEIVAYKPIEPVEKIKFPKKIIEIKEEEYKPKPTSVKVKPEAAKESAKEVIKPIFKKEERKIITAEVFKKLEFLFFLIILAGLIGSKLIKS